jgi:hypothetical protein
LGRLELSVVPSTIRPPEKLRAWLPKQASALSPAEDQRSWRLQIGELKGGALSIGCSIKLPAEQASNPYLDIEFSFEEFSPRKDAMMGGSLTDSFCSTRKEKEKKKRRRSAVVSLTGSFQASIWARKETEEE